RSWKGRRFGRDWHRPPLPREAPRPAPQPASDDGAAERTGRGILYLPRPGSCASERRMHSRPFLLIACAVLLPSLAACGEGPEELPPLSAEALSAVTKNAGAPAEKLAREVDDLFTAEGIGETRAVIVMHGGEIAAERYADGFEPDTRFIRWSMSQRVP